MSPHHHSGDQHLAQRWAGGWRCWLCPRWSVGPLQGRCYTPVYVSLSYVPGSLQRRTRTVRRWRGE